MEGVFIVLAEFCRWALTVYEWMVIIAILLTWVGPDPRNPIVRFLNRSTRPFWDWIARHAPGSLRNFSAYLSLLAIWFLKIFLPGTIVAVGSFVLGRSGLLDLPVQVAGYFALGIAVVLQNFLYFLTLLLGVWFVLTLVNPSVNNPVVRTLFILVDPFITPVQRLLPRTRIDFSPLVAGAMFLLINYFVVGELIGFSVALTRYSSARSAFRPQALTEAVLVRAPCLTAFAVPDTPGVACGPTLSKGDAP